MRKKLYLFIVSIMMTLTACSATDKKDEAVAADDNTAAAQEETLPMEDVTALKLDSTVTHQTLESFGTSGCWWSQYVGGWDNEYKDTGRTVREEIAKLLFDKNYGIGLTCYRYNIGAGSVNGEGEYWDFHRRAQSFETAPFTYDWSRDENAVWFLKEAVSRGAEEVVLFCNSPLERLTVNGMAQMTKGQKQNILPENYDDFARYVVDVAEHFVGEGIPVKLISPINEPQWEWAGGQEGCHYEPGKIAGVYRAFLEELQSRDTMDDVMLSGPESGEWGGQTSEYVSALLNDSILGTYFDTIDNHSYWSDTASKVAFRNWMDAHYPDIKLRMSEWCEMVNGSDVTMDSAFHLAEILSEDLTVLDVVSWQNWVGVAPGGYRDGLIYVNEQQQKLNPLKRLWAYGNYSRFIRPGYQRIDISGAEDAMKGLRPVAFLGTNENGEEELVLVIINEGEEQKLSLDIVGEVDYNFIDVYETSAANDLACITSMDYQAGDTIKAAGQSITTIILSKVGD